MSAAKVFTCDPKNFKMTDEMKQAYEDDGYVFIKGFLDTEELQNLRKTVEDTEQFKSRIYGVSDGEGRESRLTQWKHPGNDVTGLLARSEKVAGSAEKLLGGEVYHYHTKLMCKDPRGLGGKHIWHQDYGYWYKNGCLFPDMLSLFLPIDPCRKENGCLQVIEGSHKCGRIDHELYHGQQRCNEERLQEIKARLPHKFVEMDPGDCLFFHCNLLHCSDANLSETKRWVLIPAYNKASNNPTKIHHHPCYTPLHKVPDSAIRECRNYTDFSGKEFLDPKTDKTADVMADKTPA
ncbi:L-proline trans-4-hydroxylase-like isoform X3 [Littorina saxatilis]|uniref:L-proline trans-4-hydroxylase-like isoform X3 n=1 Tax=Littorina saxatilis TaxID=31220 RepID=UPI0038B5C8F7